MSAFNRWRRGGALAEGRRQGRWRWDGLGGGVACGTRRSPLFHPPSLCECLRLLVSWFFSMWWPACLWPPFGTVGVAVCGCRVGLRRGVGPHCARPRLYSEVRVPLPTQPGPPIIPALVLLPRRRSLSPPQVRGAQNGVGRLVGRVGLVVGAHWDETRGRWFFCPSAVAASLIGHMGAAVREPLEPPGRTPLC